MEIERSQLIVLRCAAAAAASMLLSSCAWIAVPVMVMAAGPGPSLPRLETGVTLLIRAADRNDIATMKRELAGGADPNARTSEGFSATGYALSNRSLEAVLLLLDAGVDPKQRQARREGGETSILFASMYWPELLQALVDRGVPFEARPPAWLGVADARHSLLEPLLRRRSYLLHTLRRDEPSDPWERARVAEQKRRAAERLPVNEQLIRILLRANACAALGFNPNVPQVNERLRSYKDPLVEEVAAAADADPHCVDQGRSRAGAKPPHDLSER